MTPPTSAGESVMDTLSRTWGPRPRSRSYGARRAVGPALRVRPEREDPVRRTKTAPRRVARMTDAMEERVRTAQAHDRPVSGHHGRAPEGIRLMGQRLRRWWHTSRAASFWAGTGSACNRRTDAGQRPSALRFVPGRPSCGRRSGTRPSTPWRCTHSSAGTAPFPAVRATRPGSHSRGRGMSACVGGISPIWTDLCYRLRAL